MSLYFTDADDFAAVPGTAPTELTAAEREIVAEIIDLARPAVQSDGGDLALVAIEGDRVKVHLSGACSQCAHAGQTLGGLRRRLQAALKRPLMVVPAAPAAA